MRTLLLAALLLAAALPVRAQSVADTTDYVVLPLNVSLVRGVSIGDIVADQTGARIANRVAFNVFTGRSAALRGVEFSGIWGAYEDDVRGAQFAGLGNTVGVSVRGAQFGGLMNIAGGDVEGVQFGGLMNIAGAEVRGAQFAGLMSIAGERAGTQFSGLMSIAGEQADAQFSGLMSIAGEQARSQFSGLMSIAGSDLRGVQSSGFVSIAGGAIRGVQLSGFANIAGEEVRGAQIAGVANIAPRVHGLQLGVVNVAAEHDGVPIGLVSYVETVGLRYDAWGDETGMVTAAVRSGNRRFSNYLGLSVRPTGDFRWGAVAGLGVEWPVAQRAYGAFDLLSHTLRGDSWEEWGHLAKVRLLAGYWVSPRLALFGGPTFNAFFADDADDVDIAPWSVYDTEAGGTHVRLWPGVTLGLRLLPRDRALHLAR